MSAPVSAKARARDIDRAQTCGLLDAGYAEGQLDPTEYESRTAAAMKAKTLGELDALVSDLQIPEHLVETARASAPSPRRRLPGRVVAAGVVAAVAVVGTVVFTTRGDDTAPETVVAADPVPAPVAPGEPQPIVIEPIDPVSADGVRDFVRQLGVKFNGDLRVDQVTFYPTYVFFTRMLQDQPHREQDWSYRGGFSPTREPESRSRDTTTVDLADLDVDRLADVLATGANRVGVPTGRVEHIFVRADSSTGEGLVSVLFEDKDERRGMVDTRLDGTVVDVSRADER
ncbi:DUF1707 SHOCT-like domain-containing protein [Prescottella agglutinans]|uniref:DUF1707 SHOCT-like domain-containing protein n=1 Tax=Prescottella agglutinans TaxID=1644129 RepID=UPI003D9827A9